jgi:hypothetical protein
MLDSSWKRQIALAALTLAGLGFVCGLGIHLAAWAGLNAEVAAPRFVQAVRIGFYVSMPVALIGSIYFVLHKPLRATYATLPAWIRYGLQWGVLLFMGYWLVYSAAVFTPFPVAGDTAATGQLRDESSRWLLSYWLLLQVLIEYSWGWKLLVFRNGPAQPLSR